MQAIYAAIDLHVAGYHHQTTQLLFTRMCQQGPLLARQPQQQVPCHCPLGDRDKIENSKQVMRHHYFHVSLRITRILSSLRHSPLFFCVPQYTYTAQSPL